MAWREVAARKDGTILGMRFKWYDNVGGYIRSPEPGCSFRPTGNFVGNLSNNGTGLVLGQQLGSSIPAALKSELDQVKADIISGTIKITSPSQPAAS